MKLTQFTRNKFAQPKMKPVASIDPAQNISALDGHLTLAPADANSSGGGGAGDEVKDAQAELAKKLNHPVASLISVPHAEHHPPGRTTKKFKLLETS
jgi:hypothetical protein